MKIVLASSSRYRKELLDRLGFPFETVAPRVDETPRAGEPPEDLVLRLARAKAASGVRQSGPALVIASDQVAATSGRILGKPGTREKAIANLMSIAGANVTFMTSLVVVNPRGAAHEHVDSTRVRLRDFSLDEVRRYVDLEQPLDCAGAIKSEGRGVLLLDAVETEDPTALIGLPLIRLGAMLRAEGIKP
ncbi:MAG: Maf family protein [Gammaproteobacteria bacterium]|nr:Maf family protein [Gammaproteobacteria bacterium]